VLLSGGTAQLAIAEPAGSYTVAAQYTGDANYAATLPAAETSANLTVLPAASPATNLAISPNTGISSGITDTGAVKFTGNLSTTGMTVDVFDTSTNTDLGNATVTGTSFSLALNLAEGSHVLRARATLNGTYADAFFAVLVDLTKPTSHVVNSLGTSQSSDSFPVSVAYSDPAGSGGAPASGVSSVDLYVSVNNGTFSLYQTLNVTPAASGTVPFTFAGQDRNIYAFHSIAHDAAGNTESKSNVAIEASTSVPDLNPPVTHILASSPSYSWGPFSPSNFSGLTPSSYSNGVFTLNWAGADPDQNTGVPAGSIALVNIYVQVDGGAPVLIGQPAGGTPNGSGVYTGSITYNALADGLSHNYSFFSVGVDDQQKKQYAPQAGPSAADVTFSETYTAPLGVQKLVVEDNIAERSFIQYLDVDFNQSVSSSSVLQGLANELAGTSSSRNSYVELLWYGENQTQDGSVNLFNTGTTAKVTLTGNDLSINFGPNGITSLLTGVSGTGPTKTVGDGWYALDIDPTGSGQGGLPWLTFFRLLGSATGDTTVSGPYTTSGTDAYTVYHAEGQSGLLLNADVNGDGAINSKDLAETVAAAGDKVGPAPTSFPQFQLFAGAAGPAGAVAVTQTQVQALLPEAIAGWRAAGLDSTDIRRMQGVKVEVGNLGTSILGLEAADLITISQTAAGYNWYVNAGTSSTRVFGLVGPGGEAVAGPGSPAVDRVDLLTVLEHELGHVIGLSDNAQAGDLMDITLGLGVRRAPTAADLAPIAQATSTAVPASAADVTARVLTSDEQLPQPLPLDGSVSKAMVDAALASISSAAAGNDDAWDPAVNGGSPAQSVGRFSAIGLKPGRRNQSPQTPGPFRRPPTSLFPQIIRRLVVPSASVFKPFETERGNL
jgi:hypothetical protein